MKFAKEEVGALTLATLAVVAIYFAYSRVVMDGEQFSTMGRSPAIGVIFGIVGLGVASFGLHKGSFGEPQRNGRKERPLAFWGVVFAFACFGIGLTTIATVAIFR
jgi:drug/metabolite transporter (DMT)-like permease